MRRYRLLEATITDLKSLRNAIKHMELNSPVYVSKKVKEKIMEEYSRPYTYVHWAIRFDLEGHTIIATMET